MSEPRELPAEDPNIVKGGPEDPTTQGKPAETPPATTTTPPTTEAPLHRGFVGEIKSQEELLNYTKTLENSLVEEKAKHQATTPPLQPTATTPPKKTPREIFKEQIYADPDAAFDAAVGEAEARVSQRLAAENNEKAFWVEFYDRNQDLVGMERIVTNVANANMARLRDPKMTRDQVSDFLVKESRAIMDSVKKKVGGVQTTLESRGAVTLGTSGEPAPTRPAAPAEPKNFASQIRQLRPKRK